MNTHAERIRNGWHFQRILGAMNRAQEKHSNTILDNALLAERRITGRQIKDALKEIPLADTDRNSIYAIIDDLTDDQKP